MGSLTKCSARMGKLIAPEELDEIRARTRSYTEEGMAPAEAATEAVNDQLEEAYEALDTVIKAILEQHGVDLMDEGGAEPRARRTDKTKRDYESALAKMSEMGWDVDAWRRAGLPEYIKILDNSDILRLLGFNSSSLKMRVSKSMKKSMQSRMSMADWRKLPDWVDNPLWVSRSEERGEGGEPRYDLIAPELVSGNLLHIVLEASPNGDDVLVTAYDLDRGIKPSIVSAVKNGGLLYMDPPGIEALKKKAPEFTSVTQRQMPVSLSDLRRLSGYSSEARWPVEADIARGVVPTTSRGQNPKTMVLTPAEMRNLRESDAAAGMQRARRKVQLPTQFTDYTIPTDDFRKAYANAHGRAIEKYIAAAKASGSWMRRKFVDDMYPVKLVEEAVEQGGNYDSESMNVYQRAELYYGKVGYHLESFRNEFVKPLAHELARADKKGISIDDLELYLYAKFAPVRNRKIYDLRQQMNPNTSNEWLDGGSGMSNQAAKDIIDEFTQKGQIAELEKLAQMVYALNDYRTTVAERAGLISAEVAADWRSEPTYIPLKGFADGREIAFERAPSPGKGFSVSGKEARAAKGRKSRADQLIENAIAQAELTIIRAHKNAVAQSLLSMVKSNQNESLWEIQRTGFAPRRDPSTGEFVLDSDGEKILDPLSVNRGDPATFAVKVAGKEVLIKFKGEGGERLATAMKNLGANNLGTFMQVMRGVSRWLSMTLTTLSPEFTITNFARDIQTALVNAGLENGGDVAKEMMRGIRPSLAAIFRASKAENGFGGTGKWDVLYREFQADGGKTNFGVVRDLDEIYKDIKSEISAGTESGVIKGVRRTWDYFMAANEAVENATRLAIYAASRKSGASRKDAASIAKNITVNFNRRGEFGPALNSLYLFYNASVQGTARFAQFVAKNPKKVAMYWAGPTFALGVATAFLNTFLGGADADGEDRWAKVPDHVKDRNLVLMMGDDYIKIPLPYVYNLPYVMGNKAADVMLGHTKVSTATAAIARNLWTNFNPMGDNYLLPTMVGPVLDIESNTNFFGSPIRPENSFEQYKVPDSDKYWEERTPSLYVALAKGLNAATGGSDFKSGAIDISPTTFQYWTEFWTGGIGTFTGRIWSTLQAPFDSEPGLTPPVNRVPFVNKVVGAQSEKQASVDYYARREDVNARAAELELIIDSGAMGEIPADERVTYGVTSQLSASLKAAEAQLRQLRRQHRAARDAGNDEVVRELETRMLQVQQEFNTRYVQLVRDIEGQPLR